MVVVSLPAALAGSLLRAGVTAVGQDGRVRHVTAVRRLRTIAERCQRVCGLWEESAGLLAVHAFGAVLDPPLEDRTLEVVQVALVVAASPDRVTWCARPPEFAGLAYVLDLEKAPVDWYFRPAGGPPDNHVIVRPLLIWDRGSGVQEQALTALASGRAGELRAPAPGPVRLRQQLAEELEASRTHLQLVRDGYWQRGWRSDHHGAGTYPEHHLWDAVHGYLDLLAAVEAPVRGEATAAVRGRDPDEGAELSAE